MCSTTPLLRSPAVLRTHLSSGFFRSCATRSIALCCSRPTATSVPAPGSRTLGSWSTKPMGSPSLAYCSATKCCGLKPLGSGPLQPDFYGSEAFHRSLAPHYIHHSYGRWLCLVHQSNRFVTHAKHGWSMVDPQIFWRLVIKVISSCPQLLVHVLTCKA